MPTSQNTGSKTTGGGTATSTPRNGAARVRQVAETAVDVPVGTVLVVADRFSEIVGTWAGRDSAERELRSLRTQVRRELNRVERRGGGARRKAATQARRRLSRTGQELRKAPSRVTDRVTALV